MKGLPTTASEIDSESLIEKLIACELICSVLLVDFFSADIIFRVVYGAMFQST